MKHYGLSKMAKIRIKSYLADSQTVIEDAFEIIQKYHFPSYVDHAIKKEDVYMKLSGAPDQAELYYIPNTPYSGVFESFSESGGNQARAQ